MTVDKENSKLYYTRSLEHATDAQEVRTKIGEDLAEYYATASKFNLLSKQNIDLAIVKSLVVNIAFEPAPILSETIALDKIDAEFYKNDQALTADYLLLLTPLDAVNNAMEAYCRTLK